MKKLPIYIDTDMGVDDILAISLLSRSPAYEIRGISLVNGVASMQNGIRNIQTILKALDLSCPVFVGADQAQQKSTIQFPSNDRIRANNLTLLKDIPRPPTRKNTVLPVSDLPAYIIREPKAVTLVCIGPLTNIPSVIAKRTVRRNIRKIYVMGGALSCRGNVRPRFVSEYNFRLDPKAAQKVLSTDIPVVLVPMDATKFVPARLVCSKGQTSRQLRQFYEAIQTARITETAGAVIQAVVLNNSSDFDYFYDPLVIGVLMDPSIITASKRLALTVRLKGFTLGKLLPTAGPKPNVDVITSVSAGKLYKLMFRYAIQRGAS